MRKENLISMVEDRKDELIDLVSRLIRINHGSVKRVQCLP